MQVLSAHLTNSLSLDNMSTGPYPLQFNELFLQLRPFISANLFTQVLKQKTQYIIHYALCENLVEGFALNTLLESLFNKVADLKAFNFIKKDSNKGVFL